MGNNNCRVFLFSLMLFISPTSVHFIFSMKRLSLIKRNVLKNKSFFYWNLKVSKNSPTVCSGSVSIAFATQLKSKSIKGIKVILTTSFTLVTLITNFKVFFQKCATDVITIFPKVLEKSIQDLTGLKWDRVQNSAYTKQQGHSIFQNSF